MDSFVSYRHLSLGVFILAVVILVSTMMRISMSETLLGFNQLSMLTCVSSMAMKHALTTTSVPDVPLHMSQYSPPTAGNPYHLPWIMRGVLEEEFVKTELHTEAVELLKQFDDWRPNTKVLQDVKYRLEAVRSKL